MRNSLSRASAMRFAGATVLTATTLFAGLPAAAQAAPAAADDRDRWGDRSVTVTVENDSRERLRLSPRETDVTEGDWERRPTRFIGSHDSGSFSAEASDRRGSVEGVVVYQTTFGEVEITFENPSRGRGNYDCEASSRRLDCDVEVEDGGPEAEVTVTVSRH